MYNWSMSRRRPHSKVVTNSTVIVDHNINWPQSSTYSTTNCLDRQLQLQLHMATATINCIVPKVVRYASLRPPAAPFAN